MEFHHALRITFVGQFLTTIKSGSYQEDNSSFLADFLDRVEQNVTPSVRVEQLTVVDRAAPNLTKMEKCILFHLAGYIVHKIIKFASICENCRTATQHSDDNPVGEKSMLLKFKEFKSGALCHPSQEAYDVIHHIEELFRTKTASSLMKLPNAVGVLEKEALALSSSLPSCCGVKEKIIRRFIRLRLRIEANKIQNDRKKQHLKDGHLGSKSQTKKVRKNSVPDSTSTNPRKADSASGQIQHHCPSTNINPATLSNPLPTSTQATTLILYLPAPNPHHFSLTIQNPASTSNAPPTSTQPSLLLHLPEQSQDN